MRACRGSSWCLQFGMTGRRSTRHRQVPGLRPPRGGFVVVHGFTHGRLKGQDLCPPHVAGLTLGRGRARLDNGRAQRSWWVACPTVRAIGPARCARRAAADPQRGLKSERNRRGRPSRCPHGNDTVDGNQGADIALLGAGMTASSGTRATAATSSKAGRPRRDDVQRSHPKRKYELPTALSGAALPVAEQAAARAS